MRPAGWIAVLAVSVVACGGPTTAVVVVLDSDLQVPAEIDEIVVVVDDEEGALALDQEVPVDDSTLPASFGVAREGEADDGSLGFVAKVGTERFRVTANARVGGAVTLSTRTTTSFIDGDTIRLDVFLAESCLSTTCDPGQTCRQQGCESDYVNPAALPEWEP